jgi:spermidine/putrescine transport system permease protein
MADSRVSPAARSPGMVREARHLLFSVAPGATWILVFLVLPSAYLIGVAFMTNGPYGLPQMPLSLESFKRLAGFGFFGWSPGNLYTLLRSLWQTLVATSLVVIVAYPIAYYIARNVPEHRQNLLIALVVLPYWASYLVRVYAVKLLLAKNGIVPVLATYLPFVDQQPTLLFNAFSVQVGLVYIWIPFMILPIYASLEQLDATLNEAAMDLGADRLDAFLNVTLPLSAPGLIAGSILVFIPSVGAYVIPELLGGPSNITIGRFIAAQFTSAGNWPLGAAASFVLMAIMMGSIWIYLDRAGGEMI